VSKTFVEKLFSCNEVIACFFGRQAWNVGECAEWYWVLPFVILEVMMRKFIYINLINAIF
tara:strand:- start:2110 stop:2289 length:180 start_codon:yes stop_codon:yes gene_type:complete